MSKTYKRYDNRHNKDDDYDDNFSSKQPQKGRNDWKIQRKKIVTKDFDDEEEDYFYDNINQKRRY